MACQVILRGWLDECGSAQGAAGRGGSRIHNTRMHEKRSNCVAVTSQIFVVRGMSEDDGKKAQVLGLLFQFVSLVTTWSYTCMCLLIVLFMS